MGELAGAPAYIWHLGEKDAKTDYCHLGHLCVNSPGRLNSSQLGGLRADGLLTQRLKA